MKTFLNDREFIKRLLLLLIVPTVVFSLLFFIFNQPHIVSFGFGLIAAIFVGFAPLNLKAILYPF